VAKLAARRGSSFRALRSRPFRLYFGGQVVSANGSFLQQTAIGWLVLERPERQDMLSSPAAAPAT